jgi:hypothetical protein
MGTLVIGTIIKVIIFRIFWAIGSILIFLHYNLGLPESFIKFWCCVTIAGFFVIVPYYLVRMANPGFSPSRIRILGLVCVIGLWIFSVQ